MNYGLAPIKSEAVMMSDDDGIPMTAFCWPGQQRFKTGSAPGPTALKHLSDGHLRHGRRSAPLRTAGYLKRGLGRQLNSSDRNSALKRNALILAGTQIFIATIITRWQTKRQKNSTCHNPPPNNKYSLAILLSKQSRLWSTGPQIA